MKPQDIVLPITCTEPNYTNVFLTYKVKPENSITKNELHKTLFFSNN